MDVKPDVLRDFILRDWFCEERDYGEHRYAPSDAAKTLSAELSKSLIDGAAGKREERVLAAVARVDFLLRHGSGAAHLSAPLFEALNSALPNMTPTQRIAMVEKIAAVGPYYPAEIVQILRRLRLERAADETVDGYWASRTYSQSDVVLTLAHAHHRLAHGILTDEQSARVFDELYALVLEEKRLAPRLQYGLPNDGKRAEGVIRNLLEGGPSYCREFGDVAAELVLRELTGNAENSLHIERLIAVQSIVRPLCDAQRHQTWSEGPTIHMHTQLLHESHANRKGGAKVLARIRLMLEHELDIVDDDARAVLWNMASEAHQQANYALGQLVDDQSPVLAELNTILLEDLKWVKKVLEQRSPSPRELRAAQQIWNWHAEFGGNEELGVSARDLEASYLSHPTVRLFEGLTNWDERGKTQRKVEFKASDLATAGTGAIKEFLTQAAEFLGDEDVRRIFSVATALGQLATKHESVRTFLTEGFQAYPHRAAAHEFVMTGISAWVFSRRREDQDAAVELVTKLLELGTQEKKIHLLRMLYGAHYCRDEALLNSSLDIELVRRHKSLFVEANCICDYIACTLWGLHHDWLGLKAQLEEVLQGASRDVRGNATRQLVELLHKVLASNRGATLPPDLLQWFWCQLVETADLGCIESGKSWYLGEILKALGRVPTQWLVDAVRRRAARQDGEGGFDPPSKLCRRAPESAET